MGLNVLHNILKTTSKNTGKQNSASDGGVRADVNKGKKNKRIIIWTIVAVVTVIVLLLISGLFGKSGKARQGENFTTFTVMRRDIENVLTGTGTLKPYDSYTVSALSSGEILEDYFEEGDEVAED